jgi:hypothetical protein
MVKVLPYISKMVIASDIVGWWLSNYAIGFRDNISDAVAEHLLWDNKVTVDFEYLPENTSAADFCLCYMGWILVKNGSTLYLEAAANRISKTTFSVLQNFINSGSQSDSVWKNYALNLRLFPNNKIDGFEDNPDAGVETGVYSPQVLTFATKETLLAKIAENIMPNLMPAKIAGDARKRINAYLKKQA